jgi:ketosteroid isomerase-like protein
VTESGGDEGKHMTEQQNVDVVRQVYGAFGRGDLEGILALLDPQVAWRTPGPPDLPTAGMRHGVGAVRDFFGVLLNTLDITNFEPKDFLAQDDKVVVLGTSREGVKATGNVFDFRWVHVFTLRDGRIVAFEEPADVSALVDDFRKAQMRV